MPASRRVPLLCFFAQALGSLQNITQVERLVMTELFWSREPLLGSVHPSEPWVLAALYSGHLFIWNYASQTLVKSFIHLLRQLQYQMYLVLDPFLVNFGLPFGSILSPF